MCIVLQKSYPCPSNPNSTKLCDSEYYHWEAIDCGTKTDQLPYVCERKVSDIGKFFTNLNKVNKLCVQNYKFNCNEF